MPVRGVKSKSVRLGRRPTKRLRKVADRTVDTEGVDERAERIPAPMKDRRRDVRVHEENKVVISLMTGEVRPGVPTVFYSLTRDVSVGGLRVMTSGRFASGNRVRLDLTLGRSRRRIRAVAVVRWVREIYGGEVFEMGLEFTALSAEAELALMDHVFGVRDGSGA